jgi:hypothetical protein
MKNSSRVVRFPGHNDEAIAPVTIFDGQGRILRVVPAAEFRPSAPAPRGHGHERRDRPLRPAAGSPEPGDAER